MIAKPAQKSIGTRFALIILLLVVCISAPSSSRALMRCTASNAAADVLAVQRTTTSSVIAHYRFDVVPCADEEQGRPVTDSKANVQLAKDVAPLVRWIVTKTAWTVHEAPPIHFIPYAALVKMFTGGKAADVYVKALYSDKDHSIYLPDGWRADDLRDRSILLHELVHHLQYLNQVKVTCNSEYELQAIKLQVTWLSEQGVEDPLNLIGINPLFLLMLGRCE